MSARRFKPYPAYKDSGVQWLGEIPAGWEVAPVYARYEVALGKMLDAKRVTGNSSGRYLRNVDVQWDAVNTDELPEMDSKRGSATGTCFTPATSLYARVARSAEPRSGVERSRSASTRRRFTGYDRARIKRHRPAETLSPPARRMSRWFRATHRPCR